MDRPDEGSDDLDLPKSSGETELQTMDRPHEGSDPDADGRRTAGDDRLVSRRSVIAATGMLVGNQALASNAHSSHGFNSDTHSDRTPLAQETIGNSTMNTISLIGSGSRSEYAIAVDGRLRKSRALGASVNSGDEVSADGKTATGWVGGGTDSYDFTGQITDLAVSDPSSVTVVVSPGAGDSSASGTSAVAVPGNVQATVDAVAQAGGGVIEMVPNEVYSPTDTWQLKPGITLDYNGAIVAPRADVDLWEIYPRSRIHNARNDLSEGTDGKYTSTVYSFKTSLDGDYGYQANDGRTGVYSGTTIGTGPTDGTLFRLHNDDPDNELTLVYCNQFGSGFDTIANVQAGDGSGTEGWVNGNVIDGEYQGFRRGILTHGTDDVFSNRFTGQWQTSWKCEYIWQCNSGERNVFWGTAWDTSHCEKASWQINRGEQNTFANIGVTRNVVNESGTNSNSVVDIRNPGRILATDGSGEQFYVIPKGPRANNFVEMRSETKHRTILSNRQDMNTTVAYRDGVMFEPEPLGRAPGGWPQLRYHDGSGGNPEGLYAAVDGSWVRIRLDESVVID